MFQGPQRSHLSFQSLLSEILPPRVIELLTTSLNVLYTEVKSRAVHRYRTVQHGRVRSTVTVPVPFKHLVNQADGR
jgi:hypothetical protein